MSSVHALEKFDHCGAAGHRIGGVRKISTLDFSAPLSIQNNGPNVVIGEQHQHAKNDPMDDFHAWLVPLEA